MKMKKRDKPLTIRGGKEHRLRTKARTSMFSIPKHPDFLVMEATMSLSNSLQFDMKTAKRSNNFASTSNQRVKLQRVPN